jgi:transposase
MQPEVRLARYVEALERYRGGRLSCVEAAELLGISERHFRRLRDRYEAAGAEGLIDRRRGRASGRGPSAHRLDPWGAAVDRIEFVVEQYRTRYWDFTVKHFHEALQAEHGFALGYTWTKAVLQSRGLVAIAPRRASTARSGRAGHYPA